jgi:AraC family transcriptional regulator
LATALRRKAEIGESGSLQERSLAIGDCWRVVDIVCTCGSRDRPFEERPLSMSISLVLSGAFAFRSDGGTTLLSAGSWLLVNPDQAFECSHPHGEGDRCLSFQFSPGLFEHLAHEAGAARARFEHYRLPPLRQLAQLTARAATALEEHDSLEEVAFELAGAVIPLAAEPRARATTTSGYSHRIASVLRRLESDFQRPHSLAELARDAGLSSYHFLRVFKGATGITPHQWLLRARLRHAAQLLVTTPSAVTDIALDVGFEDLSNFIRSFRAEFSASPRQYRAAARNPGRER